MRFKEQCFWDQGEKSILKRVKQSSSHSGNIPLKLVFLLMKYM